MVKYFDLITHFGITVTLRGTAWTLLIPPVLVWRVLISVRLGSIYVSQAFIFLWPSLYPLLLCE